MPLSGGDGLPHNLNRDPSQLQKKFVGRDEDLTKLDNFFSHTDTVVIAAVAGMSGIGKTELAWQWANRQIEVGRYPGGVCWIDAKSDSADNQIVWFCQFQMGAYVPEKSPTSRDSVQYCWDNWEQWSPGAVLLIFDNVEYNCFAEQIQPFCPADPKFQVLMTTRDENWFDPVQTLTLKVLQPDGARELLLLYAPRVAQESEAIAELLHWLGYLPLGVELAGRYLARSRFLSVANYVTKLKQDRLKHKSIAKRDGQMSYPHGIEAAIRLSWDELSEEAQSVAMRLSLYALNPIPLTNEQLEEWGESLSDLENLSLLQRSSCDVVELHSLVREFLRDRLDESPECETLKREVAVAVTEKGKGISDPPITVQQVAEFNPWIPHLQEVAEALLDWLVDGDIFWLYNRLASFYYGQGLYEAAEFWCRGCVSVAKQRYSDRHPATAGALNNLAQLYAGQAKYAEAQSLYTKALSILREVLPPNHPDLAACLNNLADLYQEQGKYAEAEPLHQEAVSIDRELPSNHPSLAISLNNLANLYRRQGNYTKAEPLLLEALSILREARPTNHLRLATSIDNLAGLYKEQGKYEDAEALLLEALSIVREALPPNHPQLAIHLNNLGGWYKLQRKYAEAEPLYIEALSIDREVFPFNHPSLARELNNLAGLYQEQGKYEQAEPLYLEALSINREVLPFNHPNLAISLNNLARLYQEQGKYEQAEPLYLEALTILLKSLGNDHPDTQKVGNNCLKFYRTALATGLPDTRLRQHPLGQAILEELKNELKPARECFEQGWKEAMPGETFPIAQLGDDIDDSPPPPQPDPKALQKWFEEVDRLEIPVEDGTRQIKPSTQEFVDILVEKYRQQGLNL